MDTAAIQLRKNSDTHSVQKAPLNEQCFGKWEEPEWSETCRSNGLGESLPNAQASLRTQCYQANTVFASPSLSAMLSNKAPNLEAKMEKGISNNQKVGGGSPLAMPHVFNDKQLLELNCVV